MQNSGGEILSRIEQLDCDGVAQPLQGGPGGGTYGGQHLRCGG